MKRKPRDYLRKILVACCVLVGLPELAEANLCDLAARKAAQKSDVPVTVLLALTRTETGRKKQGAFQPWPWTVNVEGKGYWFTSKSEALTFIQTYFDAGIRSFDIGCFQVNYKWHGHSFRSIADMFDPEKNADYAARFLQELKVDGAEWSDAAGSYHSRTPLLKARYRSRFEDILAGVARQPELKMEHSQPSHNYPLFSGSAASGSNGSLFGGHFYSRQPFVLLGAKS